jgi:hypothetical protein
MKKWLTTVKPGNLKQVVAKKSDVVEGESVTAVTVGESEGCVYMGHMMEDEEVEDREEDEESVGEEEGEGEADNDSPGTKDYQICIQLFLVIFHTLFRQHSRSRVFHGQSVPDPFVVVVRGRPHTTPTKRQSSRVCS